jgi:hypothetical protein
MRFAITASLVVICLSTAACATIVKGTKQKVAVNTPGVQGAMCELSSPVIGRQTVQTPGTVVLKKSRHNVTVKCTAQCYGEGVAVLASTTEIMTAGNILVGGVVGLGVDAATGAMNKYEPSVEIAMSPIPGCRGPGKGKGVPMVSAPKTGTPPS